MPGDYRWYFVSNRQWSGVWEFVCGDMAWWWDKKNKIQSAIQNKKETQQKHTNDNERIETQTSFSCSGRSVLTVSNTVFKTCLDMVRWCFFVSGQSCYSRYESETFVSKQIIPFQNMTEPHISGWELTVEIYVIIFIYQSIWIESGWNIAWNNCPQGSKLP